MDKWLNNNNAIRVVSVFIALAIWAIVHLDATNSPQTVTSNTDTKVMEAVPITQVGLDDNKYILTGMEPTVARLVVEGRISSLMTATNDDYVVKIDLSNVQPGIQEIPLEYELPKGVSFVELSPSKVTVHIEELETRTVEVEILTVGEPEKGYIIGESKFTSEIGNVVEITMPQDDFSLLDKVAVTVDVTGATALIENKRAKIEAYDNQGNVINTATFNPETLNVQTDISLPSKEVPVQLRYSGQLPNELSVSTITTDIPKVKIYAKQEQLDLIDVYDGAIVDLTKITQSGKLNIKLGGVAGVTKVEPQEIPVNVEVESSQLKTIENVPISVIGLSEGHKVKIKEASDLRLDVPIKGVPSIISRIRNTDIVLTLDVSNLSVGEHNVALTAELPAYVTTYTAEGFSYEVQIEIAEETAVQTDHEQETVDTVAPVEPEETTSTQ